MHISDLIAKYSKAGRRIHVAGDCRNGVLMALDVEGRLFTYMDGEVLNRVNEEAISGISTMAGYINPGGDGFWAAPEGSCLGFEYSSGEWRVPPSLTNARWQVMKQSYNHFVASAEVDLVNASGIGMPFIFTRDVSVGSAHNEMTVSVTESIKYIGTMTLTREQAVIAPWSLCQFNCGKDCILRLPNVDESEIWDLYPWDSSCHRKKNGNGYDVEMVTDFRFQLGMSPAVRWVEFEDFARGFKVRRTASRLADGLDYIAIDDISPKLPCNNPASRFSAYCDPSGFMEIEAAGGTPQVLTPGAETSLTVLNTYTRM